MNIPARLTADLPTPYRVTIQGRGDTSVWDTGKSDVRTLVLLHGWNVDTTLNFGAAFGALRREHRVIGVDLHGHGRGHRSSDKFHIEAVAADVLAIADRLGIEKFVPVGYSLGGAVAQEIARTSPHRCEGIVLAATSARFNQTRAEKAQFAALATAAGTARAAKRVAPPRVGDRVFRGVVRRAAARYPDWVVDVVMQADMLTLLDAGAALGRFDSTPWLPNIATPAAVISTTEDRIVDPDRQRQLASLLPNARFIPLPTDHDAPIRGDERYVAALLAAVNSVTAQGRHAV